jgi:cobalt/nickel transport system permease protein
MLLSHLFGASIVEGLITGLGVSYLQRRHPEYLTRNAQAPSEVTPAADEAAASDQDRGRPFWQIATVVTVLCVLVIAALGLVEGGGNPAKMFGSDWSMVDWPAVASMLLVTAVIAAVIVPLVYLLAPRAIRGIATAFALLAVVAPLGLVAPGFAYGEGGAEDVKAAFGYVPAGLSELSGAFSAPLSGYNLPLPFFSDANAPLWHAAVGYELSGLLGILAVGGVAYALARTLRQST